MDRVDGPEKSISEIAGLTSLSRNTIKHRPRRERRTARALHAELQALGCEGGYARLTDSIRALAQRGGKVSATSAFVPLSFELGDAFQFDWSEQGLVVGGI